MRVHKNSLEAYEFIQDHLTDIRKTILGSLISAGRDGRTCEEIEIDTGIRHQTASSCLRWMKDQGWAYETGGKRTTTSGRGAAVHRCIINVEVD